MLIIIHIVINLIFSGIYFGLGHKNFNGLDSSSTFLDYFYFSMTTSSTIGYGDISPSTMNSKIVVIIHQLLILINIVSFLLPNVKSDLVVNRDTNQEENIESVSNDSTSFEVNEKNLDLDKI